MKVTKINVKVYSQPEIQEPEKEVLKTEETEVEEIFKLAPKGCMYLALCKAGVSQVTAIEFLERFWDKFEEVLQNQGYSIIDKNEN